MKYMLLCAASAALLFSAGCSKAIKPEPVVKTVTVNVPVPLRVIPPKALAECGQEKPEFRFYDTNPVTGDVVIRKEDQPKFRAWVEQKTNCIRGWREWSK